MAPSPQELDQVRRQVESMAEKLELYPPGSIDAKLPPADRLGDLRRGRRPGARPRLLTLELVERDGLVYWELAPLPRPELRRARLGRGLLRRVLASKETAQLEPNEITGYLERLDGALTPCRGLRQWTAQGLVPCPRVAAAGRVLLFVHGTFSNSDHLFEEVQKAPNGPDLLGRALAQYTQVLAFDHPSLSVSPMLNAMDLRDAMAGSAAAVDIVCHSRGGLVSRWWMETLDPLPARSRKAVFVGSPLTGTSLASPPRLRAGLKLLSTYAVLLGGAAMAAPLLNVPSALLRIFGSVAGAGAGVPLIDAGVALVPGLSGQSRVNNAQELNRLNRNCGARPPHYFFVTSNFDPEQAGWNVLKGARQLATRAANAAADLLVFPGDNDLVVDTAAMTEPWSLEAGAPVLRFENAAGVHHTSYFQQRETIDFIARSLAIA